MQNDDALNARQLNVNALEVMRLNINALEMRLDQLSKTVGRMKKELRRERLRDASQRRAEIDKHLSAIENLMRLTAVNQMLSKTDRAIENLVALKYNLDDFNSLLRAARLGSVEAMYDLGNTFRFGVNVGENVRDAVAWYDGAAKENYAPAIAELASCYNFGVGVEMNEQKAIELYMKAAELGSTEAMCRLADMYFYADEPNYDYAFKWYLQAAALNDDEGMHRVGRCYFNGWGVELDKGKAFDWHRRAAELGNVESMYAVGMMYLTGDGVAKNKYDGFDWLKRAVEVLDERGMNLPDAPIYELACCYRDGEGTDKDEEKALELFRRVAEHGVEYQSRAEQAIADTP